MPFSVISYLPDYFTAVCRQRFTAERQACLHPAPRIGFIGQTTWLLLCLLGSAQLAAQTTPPETARWITKHTEIRVAPDPDLEPIDFIGSDGRHHGLAADYLKLISARSGLNFTMVRYKSWSEVLEALRQKRVDMLASAFISPQYNGFALFTAPYLRLSGAIFVRADDAAKPGQNKLDDFTGRRIAFVTAQVWPELLSDSMNKVTRRMYPSVSAALDALKRGEVDAYVGDAFSTTKAIARSAFKNQIVLSGSLGIESPLGFAVRQDWPELQSILDTALKQVTLDEEKSLRDHWLKSSVTDSGNEVSNDTSTLPSGHRDEINTALEALPRRRELTTEQRQHAEELLRQALLDEQHADQLRDQWQNLRATSAHVDEEAQRLEEILAHDNTAELLNWRSNLPERASIEQLEALLVRERSALADTHNAANALTSELNQQTTRPTQIRAELITARAQLDQLAVASEMADTPAALATAQHLRTQAAQRLALTQIALLEVESRSYEPRMRLLSAQLRERQRQVNEREQHVSALENLVLDRTGAAISELRERLKHERTELDNQAEVLVKAADINLSIGAELATALQRLAEVRALKDEYSDARNDAERALKNTEERLQISGVNEAVGLILLAERRKLKPLAILKHQLAGLQTELAQTRMRLIDLREQQTSLNDIGTAVNQELNHASDTPSVKAAELHQGLYQLLNTRAELVPRLTTMQTRLAEALDESEQELRALTSATDTLTGILDAQLLWTPSHTPVNLTWVKQLPIGLAHFFQSNRWSNAFERGWQEARSRPLATLFMFSLLLALFAVRSRVPRWLNHLTTPMRRIRTDRYRYTGQALLLTLLGATPLPLLLWLGGRLWQPAIDSSYAFSDELGLALSNLVLSAYAVAFLHWLCVDKGLAQYHFRWPRPRREALAHAVSWFALILLPIQFLLTLILLRNDDDITGSAGRALFVVAGVIFATLGWRLLRPGALWTLRDVLLHEPVRLRQLARIFLSLFPLFLSTLALSGYFLTALALSTHALQSLAILLLIAVLRGLATRWLVLGERRLALKRLEEKRDSGESGEARSDLNDTDVVTLASVNEQTRRLLRAATLVLLSGTLLWVWSDITPALSLLGKVSVWEASEIIDGKQLALHINLRDVLNSLVVLILTWVATRNLPGLLEVGLLRRLHMDAPTRYALTSLLRYLIAIVGTIFGIGLLGVRWSNLQWLVAGLTVGLGFGLQEIFANFVSGLIVLFERPIRIGDIVSIGNVEGTVARIRTRATTLVDWDNREVVVPNKTFITERLVNWTLSDTITRVVIKLGVTYDSNVGQVRQLLLQLANAHPLVLKEPAPSCWLIAFGPSTLDFELRVFVAEIGQRQPVRTSLQTQIGESFREHAIQMSSPQMVDVLLRQTSQDDLQQVNNLAK